MEPDIIGGAAEGWGACASAAAQLLGGLDPDVLIHDCPPDIARRGAEVIPIPADMIQATGGPR